MILFWTCQRPTNSKRTSSPGARKTGFIPLLSPRWSASGMPCKIRTTFPNIKNAKLFKISALTTSSELNMAVIGARSLDGDRSQGAAPVAWEKRKVPSSITTGNLFQIWCPHHDSNMGKPGLGILCSIHLSYGGGPLWSKLIRRGGG